MLHNMHMKKPWRDPVKGQPPKPETLAYSAKAKPIQWKYSDPSRRVRSNELTATGH